jgi:hypothetical protein
MIRYGLFFSLCSTVIRLPINPEELPLSQEGDNAIYNVLGIGEVTVPRKPKQKVVEIQSYFPARVTPAVVTPNQFQPPEFYINFFETALKERRILTYTPVRYMEDGTSYMTSDTGFKCTVESFEHTERGGETGDFYYTLRIQEYRDYTPLQVKVVTPASAATETPAQVAQTPQRSVEKSEIVVGSVCIANGNYYYTSYAEEPHGVASGRRCIVKRIVDKTRKAPYNIKGADGGSMGWISGSALTVVDNNV